MPSYVPSLPALGAKLVTVCAGNTERGLGTHQALIVSGWDGFAPRAQVNVASTSGRLWFSMPELPGSL